MPDVIYFLAFIDKPFFKDRIMFNWRNENAFTGIYMSKEAVMADLRGVVWGWEKNGDAASLERAKAVRAYSVTFPEAVEIKN